MSSVIKAIELWHKNNIRECDCEFSCGGDSMNDTTFTFYDKNGDKVNNEDTAGIEAFFEDDMYRKVEFYVNSDGHYMGEFGNVMIEVDDDEKQFTYSKSSSSEWSETFTEDVWVELEDNEVEFVKKYVGSIVGGTDDGMINYNVDFYLTDEMEEIEEDLIAKLSDEAEASEFDDIDGEYGEWFNFTTNVNDDDKPIIEGNRIKLIVNKNYNVIKESE